MPRTRSIFDTLALAPLFLCASITLVSFSNTAFAGKVDLSGVSQSNLLDACTKAGGQFHSSEEGFGCSTSKGSVECTTSGKCTGECATCGSADTAKSGNGTPLGVLSGATLKEVGTAPGKPTEEPVKTAEPGKTAEPIKTTEPAKITEKTPEPVKVAGPAKPTEPGVTKPVGGAKKDELTGSEDHHPKK
jgi:hypothetical protein